MIIAGALDTDTCIVDVRFVYLLHLTVKRGDHGCDGDVLARHIMGAINIDRFDKTKVCHISKFNNRHEIWQQAYKRNERKE